MAGFGATFANALLLHILNAESITGLSDDAAQDAATSLWASLHTGSPAAGDQSTNEATYPSYERAEIPRDDTGFTVSSNVATLTSIVAFETSTGTPNETYTHFGIGRDEDGNGLLLFYGTITPNITMNAAGITPRLTTSTSITLT